MKTKPNITKLNKTKRKIQQKNMTQNNTKQKKGGKIERYKQKTIKRIIKVVTI